MNTGMAQLTHCLVLAATVGAGRASEAAGGLQWQPYDGPAPLGMTGPAFISEPVQLENPMLEAMIDGIYTLPYAPGEAMLLQLRPGAETVQAFGFWVSPDEFCLLVREGGRWQQATRGRRVPATEAEIAYFGHEVSGQPVDWTQPARVMVLGEGGPRAIRARRVRLWEAGCTTMVLERAERELKQARQFLAWAKKPHPEAEAAADRCAEAIQETRAKLQKRTAQLLDTYMSLPEPRYALEVVAYLSRVYQRSGGLAQIGYGDSWKTVFYGRPEFAPCIEAREAAQDALWAERPETLADEAQAVFGPAARFAVSITHGLTKFRRDKPLPEPLKTSYRMCLARDEHESFQVIVASLAHEVRDAHVAVEWQGKGPHPEVTLRPVGYVETKPDPDNYAEYVGWWPDPLMPPGPVDVAVGGTQPVWGSVHATQHTPAGDHHAVVTVTAEGAPPLQCELTAHVLDFDLGFTHLPSALSLRLDSIKRFYRLDEVPQDVRRRWYAFCLQYRMNPNNIYAEESIPGEEDLQFCIERGFNTMVMHIRPLRQTTRNTQSNVEVWVSDDNTTFRKVEGGWTLTHDEEGRIAIGNLNVTARYFKVHTLFEDKQAEFSLPTLERGRMVAYDGDQPYTGPAAWAGADDGTKPLSHFGATWGAALDYERASVGVDLEEPRHVTRLVLGDSQGGAVERVRQFYEVARAHGLGDSAYVYGFDEWANTEQYDQIKHTYDRLKEAAPGIKALSTVVRPVEPITEVIDAWCPCLCYEYAEYKAARERGQEVWYYAGGTPYDPFPTHELLDVPAVEARAFFWPAWRYQYAGWLHWELNVWRNNTKGDKRWPEVPWDPARAGIRNGEDGRIYPGPDVTPLPSVRLENMRDGIEDYDYFWMLNDALNNLPDGDPRKADGQRLMHESIVALCESRAHFERGPERVLQIHERLGQAIEELTRKR